MYNRTIHNNQIREYDQKVKIATKTRFIINVEEHAGTSYKVYNSE